MTDLTRVGRIAPANLAEARLELHYAVQLIASFGQSLVKARDDDSHRSMSWVPELLGFASDWSHTTPRLRLAVQPAGLRVSLWSEGEGDGGREVAAGSLLGLTLDESYAWVEEALGGADQGLQRFKLGRPEYDMPAHAVADGAALRSDDAEDFAEFARWYASAAVALGALLKDEPHASAVRCWPHHFDLGALIVLDPEIGAETGRSVGVGFSPGDGGIAQPYWYVNMYPRPENPALPDLPGGGCWNTEGWLGAVLTGDAIVEVGDGAGQDYRIRAFLHAAVAAAKGLIS